ncbi:hypothetical protein U3516DRAFT_890992 [Neocallimastix sp. 'constans']
MKMVLYLILLFIKFFLVELKIQIENYQKKNFRVAYLNSEPDTSKIFLILLKLKLL